jgi:hypothetical protein
MEQSSELPAAEQTASASPSSDVATDGPDGRFIDPLLEELVGDWRLTRRFRSRTERNDVRVEWILNHQFLQLHMLDVKSPPGYEALVTIGYVYESSRYVVYWLDSFGGKYSAKGSGQRDEDTIRFEFQYPDGLLHNTFTLDRATGRWRSLIEQQDETGAWSVFCEDTLERR